MRWVTLGVSVAGTSHLARGTPCQDSIRHAVFGPDGEWLVVAAADGAGSASRSEVGAVLACEELVTRVQDRHPEGVQDPEAVAGLFSEVRSRVVAEAERLSLPPRELACTVLLAVVGPDTAVFAQLGDGAIVAGGDEHRRVVFWPEPAEYANATDFLTDERYAGALRIETSGEAISELSVITDGLQRLALDFANQSAHTRFFDPLFARVRGAGDATELADPLRAFLNSPRVNERTDDDKTLFLAIRRP